MNGKASIVSQPLRSAVSKIAAKRKSHYRVGARLCCLGLIFVSGIALAASRYTDLRQIKQIHGDPAAGQKKATICFACHGANGTPIAATFPRLAGQREDYLYHRLLSFKHASPKDPYYSVSAMTPNVAPLSDADMRNLAAFCIPDASGACDCDCDATGRRRGAISRRQSGARRTAMPGMPWRRCRRALNQHRPVCSLSVAARAGRAVFDRTPHEFPQAPAARHDERLYYGWCSPDAR